MSNSLYNRISDIGNEINNIATLSRLTNNKIRDFVVFFTQTLMLPYITIVNI